MVSRLIIQATSGSPSRRAATSPEPLSSLAPEIIANVPQIASDPHEAAFNWGKGDIEFWTPVTPRRMDTPTGTSSGA